MQIIDVKKQMYVSSNVQILFQTKNEKKYNLMKKKIY